MTIALTQDAVQIALRAVLLRILPAGVDVIAGVVNRVPEPTTQKFVTMVPIRITRLGTNLDGAEDVRFMASIAPTVLPATGGVMTVSAVDFGTINIGATVWGPSVVDATTVLSQTSGPTGGTGVYAVSASQTVTAEVMSAGQKTIEQPAEIVVQLDFHTGEGNDASDLAQTVSTILRDPYGVALFEEQGGGVVPLFADDPKYTAFINEAQQYEWRWVLEARFQINQVVSVPQQYADVVGVDLISVDAAIPP